MASKIPSYVTYDLHVNNATIRSETFASISFNKIWIVMTS